jgi:prepilin-type N-terminal cleavage/methylation domain-containing protein
VNVSPQPRRLAGCRRLPRSTAGVSLVELMVVVTIISLLFLTAVPTYQQIQRKARASAIVNDFRVYAGVFQAYAHENGTWPPEAAAGVVPTGITAQDLKIDAWMSVTPMGGKFDWTPRS